MKIVIDAFGGDHAPLEIIKGTLLAKAEWGHEYILTGSVAAIRTCAAENNLDISGLELVEAPSVMDMHDEAKMVLKEKADSSMAVGLKLVADGAGDAFITAGPTGAVLMGATLIVKRVKRVRRPALGVVMPGSKGRFLLMDCGANVECQPEMLDQFAVLGSIYMKKMFGAECPKVGLANNGAEDSKGTPLQVAAYQLLAKNPNIHFCGNAEGRDIPSGDFDVVVADGFTGNMILKVYEGVALFLGAQMKNMFTKNIKSKLAALLVRRDLKEITRRNDHTEVGGAPIIGLKKPVAKAHGNSDAKSFKNGIRQIIRWSESGVTEEIEAVFGSGAGDDEGR